MKAIILLWLCLVMTKLGIAKEATPQELITKIIESEHNSAYNPINDSPEELLKAESINAELRLKQLLLTSANEELKVCYALRIVNKSIRRIELMIKDETPTSIDLTTALAGPLRQREILVQYLRQIKKKNAEQAGTGQPATRPESKMEGGDKPQRESEGRSR